MARLIYHLKTHTQMKYPLNSDAVSYAVIIMTADKLGLNPGFIDEAKTLLSTGIIQPSTIGWFVKEVANCKQKAKDMNLAKKGDAIGYAIYQAMIEVRIYTDAPIIFCDEPIPANHLYCNRGVHCDWYETTKFVHVYLKCK